MKATINEKAYKLLAGLKNEEGVEVLELATSTGKVIILDVGVKAKISDLAVGRKVAEASLGGLGEVNISKNNLQVKIPKKVAIATLGSQLAGWAIKIKGKNALGSGPARILAKKSKNLIKKVGYFEESQKAALILETDDLPERESCAKILNETKANELIIAAFRGNSSVGLINVLARVVEVGVFRLLHLNYDVRKIKYGEGKVPLSQPGIFPTNDAIIYSSQVLFKVEDWDPDLTPRAVSSYSSLYGKSFQKIFQEAGQDFYKVPPEIFAPAKIKIINLANGEEYLAGKQNTGSYEAL